MARRCKTAEFAALVERARGEIPGFNVSTDLIVGFPGETEQEWRETVEFVSRVGFGDMHVFPFSARAGTKAARLPDPVDDATKKARSQEMLALARSLKRDELLRHLGTSADVLWERRLGDGIGDWIGYTPHYHKIRSSEAGIEAARICRVSIDALAADGDMLLHQPAPVAVSPRTDFCRSA